MADDQLTYQLLIEEFELLKKSTLTFDRSLKKCNAIIGKQEYSFEEMESFDSLTSKFGRTSDIYTQKVLRTIWLLLHEPFVPFIDLLNKAEKLNIIHSADQLIAIRDMRNQIAHEYIPEAITELIPDVIEFGEILFENIRVTERFIASRKKIS
jgi:hypothetical protein